MKDKLTSQMHIVVQQIISEIKRLPGGTRFWLSLPLRGKTGQEIKKKRWTKAVAESLESTQIFEIALLTCLTKHGIPDERGKLLYEWLKEWRYNGKSEKLLQDWLKTKDKHSRLESMKNAYRSE